MSLKTHRRLLVAATLAAATVGAGTFVTLRAAGSASLNALNAAYTQDFNTLANTGTSSTVPVGWDFVETGTNANTTYTAGTGSGNSGDTYSFGAAGSTERALGGLQSGSLVPTFGVSFTNNTGSTITSLDVSYVGEQWRLGTSGRQDRLDFQISTDATSLATGTWTDVNALDFNAPNSTGTAGLLDGNAAANRAAVTASITPLAIANGATIWFRWTDFNATGADDGLGVDDVSVVPHGAAAGPTATGSASPSLVPAGSQTVLTATATAGSNPTSTGLAVSCNLSAIGGSATFPLAGSGNTFTATYTVPGATAQTAYNLPCQVTDAQGRSGNFAIALTVNAPFACETGAKTSTPISSIQGSGVTSPLSGQTVEAEGIVVGNFRASGKLAGFYLQEPDATWDGNPNTSEGVFIFDGGTGIDVNVGDRVRVKGVVSEFSGTGAFLGVNRTSTLTEIGSIQAKAVCSTGNSFTRTTVSLPAATLTDLERYEGMAVSINQRLFVTGNFSLGTFGQVDLAPSVLFTPTNTPDQSTWAAQDDLNHRSVIALDDASTLSNANLYPTLFPQGGLSASNTLRVGDIVNYDPQTGTNSPLIGVFDDRFGAYRIEPTSPVTFYAANPRAAGTSVAASVGGRFRAVSANVLNFFTTLGSRGAATATEFDHQKTKIIAELIALNGDVYGLSEVQNFANGSTSGGTYTNVALQSLVDGLNCVKAGDVATCANPPVQPFAFVNTLGLGTLNGTDAIRSAIIYRSDRLQTVGGPAIYSQNDTNRPTLAQTFQPASGAKVALQTFTFVVNHFRSKGSACGNGQDDPLQGSCNGLRLNMAQNVTGWLATNPTADTAANRRQVLVGDFNAYYGEDPIQYFATHGYTNLIANLIGAAAYSYDFGSQRGYLDHALVNANMNLLVRSVAEWHNNADEPSSLEALDTSLKSVAAQAAYYAPDAFAASDHDPIVIGFNTLPGDLNDDGVVDTVDQRIEQAAVGRNASDVDRRMDFDGDGRITLNDYRLWTTYYRAFVQ